MIARMCIDGVPDKGPAPIQGTLSGDAGERKAERLTLLCERKGF